MRILFTLVFFAALGVFLRAGVQLLVARLRPPLDRHRQDHDAIAARLEALEARVARGSDERRGASRAP